MTESSSTTSVTTSSVSNTLPSSAEVPLVAAKSSSPYLSPTSVGTTPQVSGQRLSPSPDDSSSSSADPRYQIFSTLACADEEADHLLSFDYDSLPTYPIRPSYSPSHTFFGASPTSNTPLHPYLPSPFPPSVSSTSSASSSSSSPIITAHGRQHIPIDSFATHIVSFDPCVLDPYRPASMPIYQTATFHQPNIENFGPYDYTRSGNPTRTAVEQLVASLECAHAAFAFTCGMAAMTAVTRLLKIGDEIICADDVYGGLYRLLTRISSKQGITTQFVDISNTGAVQAALTPKTRLIWVETPSNPLMRITDLRNLASIAQSRGILLVVDSTMMTPCLMRPLALGADIVVHSATKFFSGHSDTMSGFVCCSTEKLARDIAFVQNAEGNGLSPFDCWLVLRGLKTLPLRLERSQANAHSLAEFLYLHPLVKRLYYAGHPKGLGSEASYRIHQRQAFGGGSVMSFETGSVKLSRKICDYCQLFKIMVSFGSCSSLIEMPCVLSHASIPQEMRTLPEDLIRISVGIENVDDLLADLSQSMKAALAFYQSDVTDGSGTTASGNNSTSESQCTKKLHCMGVGSDM